MSDVLSTFVITRISKENLANFNSNDVASLGGIILIRSRRGLHMLRNCNDALPAQRSRETSTFWERFIRVAASSAATSRLAKRVVLKDPVDASFVGDFFLRVS